jgi:hypothetical protein
MDPLTLERMNNAGCCPYGNKTTKVGFSLTVYFFLFPPVFKNLLAHQKLFWNQILPNLKKSTTPDSCSYIVDSNYRNQGDTGMETKNGKKFSIWRTWRSLRIYLGNLPCFVRFCMPEHGDHPSVRLNFPTCNITRLPATVASSHSVGPHTGISNFKSRITPSPWK